MYLVDKQSWIAVDDDETYSLVVRKIKSKALLKQFINL